MKKFKCLIARKQSKEPYTLTKDELIEHLKDENSTVLTAEKITVDEEKIKEILQSKIEEAYGEILSHHSLQTGDTTPLEEHNLDKKQEEIAQAATDWIERRLN